MRAFILKGIWLIIGGLMTLALCYGTLTMEHFFHGCAHSTFCYFIIAPCLIAYSIFAIKIMRFKMHHN